MLKFVYIHLGLVHRGNTYLQGKTLLGTLIRRNLLKSWQSSTCVPIELLNREVAAFCSQWKLSSLLNHRIPRLRNELQTCPVSAEACLPVLGHACQSVYNKSGRRLGSPKRDLKLKLSHFDSGHSSQAARRVEDPISSGSRQQSLENLE